MGRIKSTAIKRNAREMVEKNPEIFDKNFDKNKEKLIDIATPVKNFFRIT